MRVISDQTRVDVWIMAVMWCASCMHVGLVLHPEGLQALAGA
jgi:hypothetical protein